MTFWVAAAAISFLAMLWLSRPLWRGNSAQPRKPALALALAVIVPGLALGGYALQGSWRIQQSIEKAAANPEGAQALMIEGMVRGLAEKLEKNPDNAEGWSMLGRSYFVLQRFAEAAAAYAKANALTQESNAELLVSEAENLALANDRNLAGRPAQLFAQALKLQPEHPRALWFSGLAAAQSMDYEAATHYWQRLLKLELPDDFRTDLTLRLEEMRKLKSAR